MYIYILIVQNHQQWLQKFETSAGEVTSAPASGAGDAQVQMHCKYPAPWIKLVHKRSEEFKICFFFGAGFSRKVEGGWGGPERSTERLWDVQESASRDGELFIASVCDFKNRDAWHLTVCWQQWAEGCVVMLLVHRKGSCSGYRAVWSRRRRAGGRSWSSHRLISERLVKTPFLISTPLLWYFRQLIVRFNAKLFAVAMIQCDFDSLLNPAMHHSNTSSFFYLFFFTFFKVWGW